MFETLFKYPAYEFAAGKLVLALPAWQFALLPLGLALIAFLLLGYIGQRGNSRPRDRIAIAALRGLALTVAVFSLSQPLLEVRTPQAQPGVVGVLIDDSLSMRIDDRGAGTRADFVRDQLDPADGELLRALTRRFSTRLFAFGAATRELEDGSQLAFDAGASDLPAALGAALDRLAGEPLAGLIVISDGAIDAPAELDDALLELRAAGVPVHTIGVGEAEFARDIEISRVELPPRVLAGSRIIAEVTLHQRGYDGLALELVVEDDSRILYKQPIVLRPGSQRLRVPLDTEEDGARRVRFSVAAQPGELLAANNVREAVIAIDPRQMRILYFEGEPRFEMKFLRRALAGDDQLRLRGLIRTADAKYYRVGIESERELQAGFPATREELFAYDALILGSVDSSLLSREQQALIVDFVSERGGGLLLLGGRRALAEGGWRDTPLHEVLPVIFPELPSPEFTRRVKVEPTAAGWSHPALLLDADISASIERWRSLPALTVVNPIAEIKPGATLLLEGRGDPRDEPFVVLAGQRYGRGKVATFAVQNSWLWQMHYTIEVEDRSHERLWRQLLRWLVDTVPQRLELSLSADSIHAGGRLRLRAELLDDGGDLASAPPNARIIAPDGRERVMPMTPHPVAPRVYTAELAVDEPGDYLARAEIESGPAFVDSREARFHVARAGNEFHGAEMNPALLRRVAAATGGEFHRAADAAGAVTALGASERGSRALLRLELWDMPILFVLLIALLGAEWVYRRLRGLA